MPTSCKTALLAAALLVTCSLGAFTSLPEDDRPAVELTFRWDGSAWSPDSRILYSYDRPGGEATLVRHQTWQGGDWQIASEERWTLDAEGRQVAGAVLGWEDSVRTEQMTMRFFYDDAGHKTAARRRVLHGDGTARNADSLASTFADGVETERRFFQWQDGAWSEGLRQTSMYGPEGREVTRVHLVPGADGLQAQRRWVFTYDGEGRRSSNTVEQWADGAWTPWLRQTYDYDGRGNVTAVVHEQWEETGWTMMMKNETRYGSAR